MRIGALARRAGTTVRALRFSESRGLLSARRGANGYREYGESDVRVVAEIRTLQAVGMSLDDTRPFVECLRAGHGAGDACADSIEVYRRKLAEVDECLAGWAKCAPIWWRSWARRWPGSPAPATPSRRAERHRRLVR